MDNIGLFHEAIDREMTATLATAEGGRVTMRTVSPVLYRGEVLIFTSPSSLKYRQLAKNPLCCLSVGPFFAEAKAQLCGGTMLEGNASLREAYSRKFPGAFDEGVEFGGRGSDFILLRPTRLTGWVPNGEGIPGAPFDIALE